MRIIAIVALLALGMLSAGVSKAGDPFAAVLEWIAAICLIAGLALLGVQLSVLPF